MANVHVRRLLSNILQIRFFNSLPSTKLPKKPPLLPNKRTQTTPHKPKPKPKPKIESFKSISPRSFPIQYLTKSCGLSLESAISTSNKVALDKKKKAQFDSVVSFLKSHEFSDEQVVRLIEKTPQVLLCRVSTNLQPKFKFLAENGIKGLNLPKIVLASSAILLRSLGGQLKPAMTLLKAIISDPERVLVAIQRSGWLLTSGLRDMQHNLDFLVEQGVPNNRIEEMIVLQPRCLYQTADRLKYGVKMIKKMGVRPTELKFIHMLRVVLSLSEVGWRRKVEVFESLGWSKDEVISTFLGNPHCLSISEKKLRYAMDYYVNTLKVERQTIIGYPKVLMYSIEKRVHPRYAVWKVLEMHELTKNSKFIWVLNKSEEEFVAKYVTKYAQVVPSLLMTYIRSKEGSIRPVKS